MPIDCCHGAFAKRGPRRPWPVEQAAATSGRLAQEQHAAAVYRAPAAKRSGEDREILLALARAEERHAAHWAAKLHPAQRPDTEPGWRCAA